MQWEYYRLATVESCLDEALRDLGVEGWELVSIMPETRMFHGFQCVLKRPCTNKEPTRLNQPPLPHRFNKLLAVR
jgi:hypothetical protein